MKGQEDEKTEATILTNQQKTTNTEGVCVHLTDSDSHLFSKQSQKNYFNLLNLSHLFSHHK